MEELPKGTVTSLSSLFPPEEAQKASKRVLDTIAERQKELDQLRDFAVDNTSLISLVQKLPDELHHDIMVPFGKAAFFPGRLIHTNELLVLLGEGYYAERTSKQTIDLLKRRGKALESQVESLKAVMQDLKAEASFFEATAAEVAEGLVEIREEYIEETPAEVVSNAGPVKPDPSNFSKAKSTESVTEDEEFANFMSKIDELEREELAEESDNECDETADEDDDEEFARMMSKLDEMEKKELSAESVSDYDKDEHVRADFGHHRSQDSFDHEHRSAELNMQFEGSKLQSVSGDKSQSDRSSTLTKFSSAEKASVLPEVNKKSEADSQSRTKVLLADSGPSSATKSNSAEKALVLPEVKNSEAESQSQTKAFTGSIVEHSHNLQINPREQATASSKSMTPQTSKPVSRFKMQRR